MILTLLQVNQYYSDVSIVDLNDNEVCHKMFKVIRPAFKIKSKLDPKIILRF